MKKRQNKNFGFSGSTLERLLNRKYEILLVSLLILLFGIMLVPAAYQDIFRNVFLWQTLLPGILLYYHSKKKYFILVLMLLQLLTAVLETTGYLNNQHLLSGFFYIVYFLTISSKLFIDIYRTKIFSTEIIFALFSGFIIIGFIGGFIFIMLEAFSPHSFSHLSQGFNRFTDLQYLSFVTILTIGYGDITPLTLHAKKAVVLIGLAGHLYSVFITGIIIGKYIAWQNKK
jgi:voltage-gated potassium channel